MNKWLWKVAAVVGVAFWLYAVTSDDPVLRCQALPNCSMVLVNPETKT